MAVFEGRDSSLVRERLNTTASLPEWPGLVPVGDPGAASRANGRLGRAIEYEVIPRLLLAHRGASPRMLAASGWTARPQDVVEMAGCAVADAESASDFVAELRARGAAIESLYLDIMAPAARRLGEMWEDDTLSFVDVSIGLLRLHQVLRSLASEFRAEAAADRPGRRALLVPGPGEQHGFGLSMVTEFFRRAGWSVWAGVPASTDELLSLVRGEWFGVIGFSVSCDARLDTLAASIRRVRLASRNPAIGVMVGGPIFILHPDLVAAVGADATATDGRHATFQAEGLLALQPAMH